MTAPAIETRHFAEFMAPGGRLRYVGHGAQMPFDKGEARAFKTKGEAAAALGKVHPAHRSGPYQKIRARRVVMAIPAALLALGLE